jgi:hypothetical protein
MFLIWHRHLHDRGRLNRYGLLYDMHRCGIGLAFSPGHVRFLLYTDTKYQI